MKLVGDALAQQKQMETALAIAPWGVLRGREGTVGKHGVRGQGTWHGWGQQARRVVARGVAG